MAFAIRRRPSLNPTNMKRILHFKNITFRSSYNWFKIDIQGFVVGHWGEGSKDLHTFVQTCAEAKVAHLVRASGRQESEHLLGMVVGQYRRILSTTAVRAQAMCLLARVGLVTPAAKEAAGRRELAMRMAEALKRERRAQWMASLAGPGWARRGNCHTMS